MRQSNGAGLTLLLGVVVLGVIVIGLSVGVLMRVDSGGSQNDPSWARVRTAGTLVVGTAADNPPFSYYDDSLRLTGYDIALATSLAARLGLQVRFVDVAFEGLPAALRVGQIDVAVAAISVTPDRAAALDFSDIYFVGSDGILARQGDRIGQMRAVADMSGRRVGVQRASVYEDWLKPVLPAGNLLTYPRTDDAMRDLKAQRVDLVVLDLQPAEAFARDGSLTVVGRGLYEQRYAIALSPGSTSLLTQINRALAAARTDGELEKLARQHLKLEPGQMPALPTPVPSPSPRPAPPPPPGCSSAMAVLESTGLAGSPAGGPAAVQPGQQFTRGWKLKNTGSCGWTSKFRLVFADGNVPGARMGVDVVPLPGEVPAGGTTNLNLDLAAPLVPGTYQGFWQLLDDKNTPFGQRLEIRVAVQPPPTPTAEPTATPSPQIQLNTDRARVRAGERVTITWRVTNAKTVFLSGPGERWQDNPVSASGQRDIYPQTTGVYELRVVKTNNEVEIRQARIEVEAAAGAPVVTKFVTDPPAVTTGQCIDISWDIRGEVTRVNIASGTATIWDGAPTNGIVRDCPNSPGNIEYRLEAIGPGGSARAQRYATVTRASTPVPTPTAPTIIGFTVTPARIQTNGCVRINWSVTGGATLVRIQRNGMIVLDNASIFGEVQDCLRSSGTAIYRIDAVNAAGQSTNREQQVMVTDATPTGPPAIGTWRVTRLLTAQGLVAPVPLSLLTIQFLDSSRIEGSAGCNSYSARYSYDSSQAFRLTEINYSGYVCEGPPGIMPQELRFLDSLRAATRYSLTSDTFTLMDASGNVVLELRDDRYFPR